MHALRELQFAFGDAVTFGTGYVLQQVRPNGLSAAQRVAIYRNSVHETLIGALRGTYPVIEKLVGEAFFRGAAELHVRGYPSTSGDVRRYGDGFAHFLENFAAAAKLPYLPDVARLEWAFSESFGAPDAPCRLDLAALAQVPQERWEELGFTLDPSVQLVASLYPVDRIWRVNQDDARPDQRVSLDEGGVHLLVLRSDDAVGIHRLDLAEHAFLSALQRGESLADAHERGFEADEGFPLAAILNKHITLGTFATWHVPHHH